jgi:hypothetical protein
MSRAPRSWGKPMSELPISIFSFLGLPLSKFPFLLQWEFNAQALDSVIAYALEMPIRRSQTRKIPIIFPVYLGN